MIGFLEQSFGVAFAARQFDQGVFDSVSALSAFVLKTTPARAS
jgi:hypothetical protein